MVTQPTSPAYHVIRQLAAVGLLLSHFISPVRPIAPNVHSPLASALGEVFISKQLRQIVFLLHKPTADIVSSEGDVALEEQIALPAVDPYGISVTLPSRLRRSLTNIQNLIYVVFAPVFSDQVSGIMVPSASNIALTGT